MSNESKSDVAKEVPEQIWIASDDAYPRYFTNAVDAGNTGIEYVRAQSSPAQPGCRHCDEPFCRVCAVTCCQCSTVNTDVFNIQRELCPDCVKAAKLAYSDATTPGFMFDKCDQHRKTAIASLAQPAGEFFESRIRNQAGNIIYEVFGAQNIRYKPERAIVKKLSKLQDLITEALLVAHRSAASPPAQDAQQDWCDHCSGDLNDANHVLCEKCYRRFDSNEYDRATAGLSSEEKALYPRHPNDPALQDAQPKEGLQGLVTCPECEGCGMVEPPASTGGLTCPRCQRDVELLVNKLCNECAAFQFSAPSQPKG